MRQRHAPSIVRYSHSPGCFYIKRTPSHFFLYSYVKTVFLPLRKGMQQVGGIMHRRNHKLEEKNEDVHNSITHSYIIFERLQQ